MLNAPGINQLQDTFNRLKSRYDHITQDLKQKDVTRDEFEIKRLEREFLAIDIERIGRIISRLKLSRHTKIPTKAKLGVTVVYRQNHKIAKITLVDSLEVDASLGLVSVESPIGSALYKHRVNDHVLVITPRGIEQLTILKLS
jgi:transcription elongation factor GreA